MQPPNPIFIYRAGIKNLLDFSILWHIALCGLTGSCLPDLRAAINANDNTTRGSLARLESLKLIVAAPNRDLPGHPIAWTCSRLGYRLMTGHLQAKEKTAASAQLPMASEVIHTS